MTRLFILSFPEPSHFFTASAKSFHPPVPPQSSSIPSVRTAIKFPQMDLYSHRDGGVERSDAPQNNCAPRVEVVNGGCTEESFGTVRVELLPRRDRVPLERR
jgi:hypothetical protein